MPPRAARHRSYHGSKLTGSDPAQPLTDPRAVCSQSRGPHPISRASRPGLFRLLRSQQSHYLLKHQR